MTPTRALIAILLMSLPAFGQKKNEPDLKLTTSGSLTYSTQPPVTPIYEQWIDKDGAYHSEFKDTENKWRCRVTSAWPDYANAVTIVCSKDTEPEKRK